MLIPLRHEQMSARRWPIVTFVLIGLNVLIFLFTHSAMDEESQALLATKAHILMLSALHPEVIVPDREQKLVDSIRNSKPAIWRELQNGNRPVADVWDARMRMMEEKETLQAEMDKLAAAYEEQSASSILEHYGFVPSSPTGVSYITANFLHGGWLHLIGNMWFLWLAGFALEDVWGRTVYSFFYLFAGTMALQIYAWTNPASLIPLVGASGAIAGLMGAFLVRFPNLKIDMVWIWLLGFRFGKYRFSMRAIWLLPFWVLLEVLYGTVIGSMDGVAHWAHVAGFMFGVVFGVGMKYSGFEQKMNAAIEDKVTTKADPVIAEASDLIDQNRFDDAVRSLDSYLVRNPNSMDAHALLKQAALRKGDKTAHLAAIVKLCDLHLKARENEAAWESFEELHQYGGSSELLPINTWYEMCRVAENSNYNETAVSEYDKLAKTFPSDRQALQALLGAARVSMKKLQKPQDAVRYFEAAHASTVPHLDYETAISAGIKEAQAMMRGGAFSAGAGR